MTKTELLFFVEKRLKNKYNLDIDIWTDGTYILVDGERMRGHKSIQEIVDSIKDYTSCFGISAEEEVVSVISADIAINF